jgi:hypothetical protein
MYKGLDKTEKICHTLIVYVISWCMVWAKEDCMKKLLFLALILLVLGVVFAEDASVLPAGVGRVYLTPVYGSNGAQTGYNSTLLDSSLFAGTDKQGDTGALIQGIAVEYGVVDWISAELQWTPAWNFYSKTSEGGKTAGTRQSFPTAVLNLYTNSVDFNGPSDLFVGAKMRLSGPVPQQKANNFLISVAPGVKIPFPGSDWDGETQKVKLGTSNLTKSFNSLDLDKHAWGFGARTYINYYITEMFYVNLYNETILYPIRAKAGDLASGSGGWETQYGPDITFELEPHIDHQITEGVRMGFGVPLEFKYNGIQEYYLNDQNVSSQEATSLLSVKPKMSAFFTSLPLPIEVSGEYNAPINGIGASSLHKVVVQVKGYFKLP